MTHSPSVTPFDATTQENINRWLNGHYDENTKNEIREMISKNPQEAIDAFFTHLEFGTGGLRGVMGVGSNRMNLYTVMTATQGLANYINAQVKEGSVFISYDSRHHSIEFAQAAAKVLAGNGIIVFITKELRPTPLVSFGCRYKECTSAIMITASHNPPQYNGYKVYWDDGGQVLPPHDKGIIQEVSKITDVDQIKSVEDFHHPLIHIVGDEIDHAYLESIATLQIHPEMNLKKGKELKIVYTSLHGTGITLMPKALEQAGFSNVAYVEDQIIPNGDFPTVSYPNPEERKALELGIAKLEQVGGDLLIATDPDADRVGIAVRHEGKTVLLTGNQVACLCADFLCRNLLEQGKLPAQMTVVKSIVTSELVREICTSYKRACVDVLTGFKYIAEKIREWEEQKNSKHQFLFGAEESYGYLLGTFSRDKDAIVSSVLIAEMALWCKLNGQTLVDYLNELFRKHGIYYQTIETLKFEESREGREKMSAVMKGLRETPPREIGGYRVVKREDFDLGTETILKDESSGSESHPIPFPKSNVLTFFLEDGSKLTIRPSGTEPKVKVYCEVVMKKFVNIQKGLHEAAEKGSVLIKGLYRT